MSLPEAIIITKPLEGIELKEINKLETRLNGRKVEQINVDDRTAPDSFKANVQEIAKYRELAGREVRKACLFEIAAIVSFFVISLLTLFIAPPLFVLLFFVAALPCLVGGNGLAIYYGNSSDDYYIKADKIEIENQKIKVLQEKRLSRKKT